MSHYVLHGKTIAETVKQLLTKVKLQLNSEDLSSLYLDALKRVRPTCRISSTSQRESILFLVVDLILYVEQYVRLDLLVANLVLKLSLS